jgi:transcription elongation GreA/GreB family factor
MGKAEAEGDREQIALNARDLRYWSARRESAEVSVPDGESDVVRFGMTVQLKGADGKLVTWKITGEDEADVKHHRISYVSPMAVALFGKKQGAVISLNDREWEIVSLSSDAS